MLGTVHVSARIWSSCHFEQSGPALEGLYGDQNRNGPFHCRFCDRIISASQQVIRSIRTASVDEISLPCTLYDNQVIAGVFLIRSRACVFES